MTANKSVYFWCCPAGKLTGHSSLHLIWLLTAQNPFNLSQWLTLRPHQIILWKPSELHWGSSEEALFSCLQRKGMIHLFLLQEVKKAFGGWDLTVLLLSVGEGRQGEAGEIESSWGIAWWISSEISCCVPPLLLRRTRLFVVGVNLLLCTSRELWH